jgi:hypothetical protein
LPLLRTYISIRLEVHQATLINFYVLGKSDTFHKENVYQQRDESPHDEGHKQVKVQHISRTAQLPGRKSLQ